MRHPWRAGTKGRPRKERPKAQVPRKHQKLGKVSTCETWGEQAPGKLTEHVHEEEGNASPALGLVSRPVIIKLAHQHGNDDVRNSHDGRAPEQKRTASETIHGPDRARHANQLSDIEDTSQHKLHRVVLAHRLEERRSVVDQRVNTNKLLEEHNAHTDMRAAPATLLEAVGPGGELEPNAVGRLPAAKKLRVSLLSHLLLEGDLGADVIPLLENAGVRLGQLTELGKAFESLLVSALGCEPAGREGQEDNANTEDQTGEDLDEEGQAPRPLARDVLRAVSDPVSNDDTGDNAELLKH